MIDIYTNFAQRALAPIAISWAVSACGGAPPTAKAPEPCAPQQMTISVLSSRAVNRDAKGNARPVIVRIYQLKTDARLYSASFDQIWKEDKATLADDFVASQELEIYPGTRTDVKFERAPTVSHVVGVALFSTPVGRAWVANLDLPPLPVAGKCGASTCAAGDEDCKAANVQAPHLVYYVDGNRIDDGIEHLDDYPTTGALKPDSHKARN
jgi:type VI secretion system protein VasD